MKLDLVVGKKRKDQKVEQVRVVESLKMEREQEAGYRISLGFALLSE